MSKPKYARGRANGEPYAIVIHAEKLYTYLVNVFYNEKYMPKKYRYAVVDTINRQALDMCSMIDCAMQMHPAYRKHAKKKIKMLEAAKDTYGKLHSAVLIGLQLGQFKNPEEMARLFEELSNSFNYTIRNAYKVYHSLPSRKEYRKKREKKYESQKKWKEKANRWNIEGDRDSKGWYVLKPIMRDKDGFLVLLETKERKEAKRAKQAENRKNRERERLERAMK